jgi:hypothetical protein
MAKNLIFQARKPFVRATVGAGNPSMLRMRDDIRTLIQGNDPEVLKVLANVQEIQKRILGANRSEETAA